MQVQVVENWAELSGTIRKIEPHASLENYWTALLEVEEVTSVPDYPNLFEWAKGRTIEVNIPASKVQELGLSPGKKIAGRVRKAGPTSAFVRPDTVVTR